MTLIPKARVVPLSSGYFADTNTRDGGVLQMTPAEWAKIPDNPRQRNTKARAKRAEHLRQPHPTHAKVNMAVLPDGKRIKLDGHTRSYVWEHGMVLPPSKLDVQVWICANELAACDLYTTFDSPLATETAADRMYGGTNELGLHFESDLLKSKRYANALALAHHSLFGATGDDTYALLRYWAPELRLFDKSQPNRKRYFGAVAAGALLTFRKYGPEAVPFWSCYSNNAGVKMDREMDAVQALDERVTAFIRAGHTVGRAHALKMIATAISAFERDRRKETYSIQGSGIKAMHSGALKTWLVEAASANRSWR